MNPAYYFVIAAIVVAGVILAGSSVQYGSGGNESAFIQTTQPLIDSREGASSFRAFTFNNCQNLLNNTITFNGKVMYSECGKNCLGGCPNTGPRYCFYGIQNTDGCMVYVKNKVVSWMPDVPDEYVSKYQFGEEVEVTGFVSLYRAPYCNLVDEQGYLPECYYFVLGGTTFE